MPQKGTAVRPEPISERVSLLESKHVGEQVSERASPEMEELTPPASGTVAPQSNKEAGEQASGQASDRASPLARKTASLRTGEKSSPQVSKRASMPATRQATWDPDDPAEYLDGPRSSVSFRMTERLKDRLRDYAHFSRRQKQDIMDQAVHEFLRREGY
jgi:hypothetical protein